MKKVLIFLPSLATGGVSKIVSDYVHNFKEQNISYELLTLNIASNIYYEDLNIKINIIGNSNNFFKRLYNEYKIIKNGKFDVIHINGSSGARIIECIAAKFAGVKTIIIHSHSSNSESNNKYKKIVHKYCKELLKYFATDFFACSNNAAQWMFPKTIVENSYYKIINNGIDIEKFKFDLNERNNLRNKYKVSNKYVIGHVGRFCDVKNHIFIINLFAELIKDKPNYALLLLGTGELENDIKEKVKELGLDNYVLFLENKNDIYKYYNMMDCFVLPSKFEGFPIVAIEAQANGLNTIISSNITKNVKITDLISFLPIEQKDLKKWKNRIIECKSELDFNTRSNYYKQVKKANYDIKDIAFELEKFYLNK